jgi:hypothetical protein
MEYRLVTTELLEDLAAAVQVYIAKGWRPIGGVSFGLSTWTQAMVRDHIDVVYTATSSTGDFVCPKCGNIGLASAYGPNCTNCENRALGYY